MSVQTGVAHVEILPQFAGFGAQARAGMRAASAEMAAEAKVLGHETGAKMGEAMSEGMKLIGISAAAFGGFELLKKSIEAGDVLKETTDRLKVSAENVGLQWSKVAPHLREVRVEGEKLGYANDRVTDAYGTLLTRTGDAELAQKQLLGAMNLARFKHIDLAAASDQVTRAFQGNSKALKQLGIVLPAHATEAQKAAAAQKFLNRVQGQGDAYTETLAGKTAVLKAKMHDLAATVGEKLAPELAKVVGWITDKLVPAIETKLIPATEAFVKRHGPTFKQIMSDVGTALRDAYGWLRQVFDKLKEFIPEDKRKKVLELALALAALKKVGAIDLGFKVAGTGLSAVSSLSGAGGTAALSQPEIAAIVAAVVASVLEVKWGVQAGQAPGAKAGQPYQQQVEDFRKHPTLTGGGKLALETSPLGIGSFEITRLVKSGEWSKLFEGFMRNFGSPAAQWFRTQPAKLWREMSAPVVREFDRIKSTITTGFDGWWRTHGDEVKQLWREIWTNVSRIFHLFWDPIVDIFRSKGLRAVIRELMHDLNVAFHVGLDVVVGTFRQGWTVLRTAARVGAAYLQALVKDGWDVIVGIFSVALDLLTGHWSRAWTDIKQTATQVWHNTTDFFAGSFAALREGWDSLWSGLKTTVSSIWRDIKGEVATGLNAVIANLDTLIDAANNLPGVHIPRISPISVVDNASHGAGGGGSRLVGARAGGGPVHGGQPYIVGEHRPELFIPDRSGTIEPRVPAIGGVTVHVHNPAPEKASESVPAALRRLAFQMGG